MYIIIFFLDLSIVVHFIYLTFIIIAVHISLHELFFVVCPVLEEWVIMYLVHSFVS